MIGTRWGGRWVGQRGPPWHGVAAAPLWASLTEGLPELSQPAHSVPRLVSNPFRSLESAKCGVHIEGLTKGRIRAKKAAWLLEVLSSRSVSHLLSLNYFLSVKSLQILLFSSEFSVVRYFKNLGRICLYSSFPRLRQVSPTE